MNNWYYAKNNKQHGPVSKLKLLDLVRNGHLELHDLVWINGMSRWQPAHSVIDLLKPTEGAAAVQNRTLDTPNGNTAPFSPIANQVDKQTGFSSAETKAPHSGPVLESEERVGAAANSASADTDGFFSVTGRANRKKYFLQILGPCFLSGFGSSFMGTGPENIGFALILVAAGQILMLFPAVRRLHDLGASGWWLLIWFIPLLFAVLGLLISLVLGLTLLFKPGTDGPNQYGPDPLRGNPSVAQV